VIFLARGVEVKDLVHGDRLSSSIVAQHVIVK
jgi:hypothetical protein